jgi:hypothetical protein
MLQYQSGYLAVSQQKATAQNAYAQADRQIEVLSKQRIMLDQLLAQTHQALKAETAANAKVIEAGNQVLAQRESDLVDSEDTKLKLVAFKKQTQQMLAAGLITHEQAIQSFAQVQSFNTTVTDTKTWDINLRQQMNDLARKRSTLNGSVESVEGVAVLKMYADLKQTSLQNMSDLNTALDAASAAKKQLDLASAALETLDQTAYHAAMKGGSNLAFIPYDNRSIAKVGAEVYDCALTIVFCHKVGTIRHVYSDEQVADFPLYNIKLVRTTRGFMVDLDMSEPAAMGSSILFVNKPLLF